MRLMSGVLAGLVLTSTAQAEDWRAVATSHHDLVFVDVDSVERQSDGRISFLARNRLDENDSNRDFGYDRIDLALEGRCERLPDGQPVPAVGGATYYLKGKRIPPVGWRKEGLQEDIAGLVAEICEGSVGHRRYVDLDKAMSEYAGHGSVERLAAHVTPEVELVGTVVQGFEMNGVSLCGSEEGCREGSPREFCWLDGGISVPVPQGALEWVNGGPRRDSAGAAFKGRILRARGRNGFGHLGGFACLVQVTGPARFVEVPKRKEEPRSEAAPGLGPEAVAAHQAFVASVKAAGAVRLGRGERRWEADDFTPGASGGACYSLPRLRGGESGYNSPVLGWPELRKMSREGTTITLVSRDWDPDLTFHFPDPKAAAGAEPFVRKLAERGVAAISQTRAKVAIRFSDGGEESFRFADSAAAVRAAGMAERLRGHEIAEVKREINRVSATPLKRITLTFPDEALAAEGERRMEALRAVCGATAARAVIPARAGTSGR